LESIIKENLALAFRGTIQSVSAGSGITGEILGGGSTTAAVGDLLAFAKRNASAVVIKDSTGTPKTLVANTNYSLNAKAGHITLLDITTGGPYVQPFKADYTPGACYEVGLLTQGSVEYYLRFEGLNTADTNEPVIIDLYRVMFDPAKEFALLTDDFAKFVLDGSPLMDSARASNAALGQFGAVYNLK
jgi:hypothetical protein